LVGLFLALGASVFLAAGFLALVADLGLAAFFALASFLGLAAACCNGGKEYW